MPYLLRGLPSDILNVPTFHAAAKAPAIAATQVGLRHRLTGLPRERHRARHELRRGVGGQRPLPPADRGLRLTRCQCRRASRGRRR